MTTSRIDDAKTNEVEQSKALVRSRHGQSDVRQQDAVSLGGKALDLQMEGLPENELQQVIVKLGRSNADLEAFKSAYDVETTETTQFLGFELWTVSSDRLSAMSDAVAAGDIAALEAIDSLEYLQPNYTLSADLAATDLAATSSTNFRRLWGLENRGQTGGVTDADIDAPEAWEISTGRDVVVGVIDSGIDYTHPDLVDSLWTNPGEIPNNNIDDDGNGYVDDYYGYDFVNEDGDPFDDDGHGTHVSGTIAANGDNQFGSVGVAPNAKIMALKFLDSASEGSTFDAIQAIEYAILMGADVTNNSWGGGGYSQALRDTIAAAANVGQLFIAAAGNFGINNDREPQFPSNYDLDHIISVGSSTASDRLSSFSNYGQTSVDIVAPGSDIYSTLPGGRYGVLSGTSMATPHVTGVAALLLSAYPDLSTNELKAAILESVDLRPAFTNAVASGGRLNASQALSIAGPNAEPAVPIADTSSNLSFEAGLADWEPFGSVSVEAAIADISAPAGSLQAVVSTQAGAVGADLLEKAIGLGRGSLNGLGNGVAVEGSALRTTVEVDAGATLTFDWNFLTGEPTRDASNDYSFFSADGDLIELADLGTDLAEIAQPPTSDLAFETAAGYQSFSYTFETSGAVTLTFGVVDVNDAQIDSALLLDNLVLSGPTPEPSGTEPPGTEPPSASPPIKTPAEASGLDLASDRLSTVDPLTASDDLIAANAAAGPTGDVWESQPSSIFGVESLQKSSLEIANPVATGALDQIAIDMTPDNPIADNGLDLLSRTASAL